MRDPQTGTIWNKRRQTEKAMRKGMSGRQWVKKRKAIQRAHRAMDKAVVELRSA